MIYEFITPSDPITFIANDNKIAIAASIIVGEGKAGCRNEHGDSLPTMWLFHPDPLSELKDILGQDFEPYVDSHKEEVSECLRSFAYGSVQDRKTYDDAIASITDPLLLEQFKSKHEDGNRSSMSRWVKHAWRLGEMLSSEQGAQVSDTTEAK